jgi:RimJ/RimL family protein N-acetyltransferase
MRPAPEVTVREAGLADRERVRAFYAATASGRPGLPAAGDRVLVAEQRGEVIGAVRLCLEEGVRVLRTMRVRADAQRRGVGRALLRRFVPLLGGSACYCLPYGHLTGFYGEIGFETAGPEALPPHLAHRLAGYQAERPAQNLIAMRRPAIAPPSPLRSARLELRPLAAEDAAELHRQWNDPRVGRFLWDGRPVPRARVDEVVDASAADFAARGFGLWTVLVEGGGRAGFCGLRREADTGRVELLYALDPAFWGRGLATEAARLALADAFGRLRLPRVFAGTNPANEASGRVLERAGLRRLESRRTATEELLVYVIERPYDGGVDAIVARLRAQLEGLPLLLGSAPPAALRAKSPSGKWSAHDNLAHIARQQEVFLGRLRRILAEDAPALAPYRAEEDPEWPAFSARPTDEVLGRLQQGRAELVEAVAGLAPFALARIGRHSRFGPMPLALWLEFFLVHEAHHLYTAFRRARGLD